MNYSVVGDSIDINLDFIVQHWFGIGFGNKMKGSEMIGGIGNLTRLRNQFYRDVGTQHGLSRNISKRLSESDKQSLSKEVLKVLKTDPVMNSSIYPCVRDLIVLDPLPFAQMLSIATPKRNELDKSFVDYKRSRGRGSFVT